MLSGAADVGAEGIAALGVAGAAGVGVEGVGAVGTVGAAGVDVEGIGAVGTVGAVGVGVEGMGAGFINSSMRTMRCMRFTPLIADMAADHPPRRSCGAKKCALELNQIKYVPIEVHLWQKKCVHAWPARCCRSRARWIKKIPLVIERQPNSFMF